MNPSQVSRLVMGAAGLLAVVGASVLLAFKVEALPIGVLAAGAVLLWFAALGRRGLTLLAMALCKIGRAAAATARWLASVAARTVAGLRARRQRRLALMHIRPPVPAKINLAEAVGDTRVTIGDLRAINEDPNYFMTNIAGGSYPNANGTLRGPRLAALVPDAPLILARERRNRHDPHAIAILNSQRQQLGYLPRARAEVIAPRMDRGDLFFAWVIARKEEEIPSAIINVARVEKDSPHAEFVRMHHGCRWR